MLKERKNMLCTAVFQLPCLSLFMLSQLMSWILSSWVLEEGDLRGKCSDCLLSSGRRHHCSLTQYVERRKVTAFPIKAIFLSSITMGEYYWLVFASICRNLGGLTYLERSLFLHWYKLWFCLFFLKVLVTSYLKNITRARQKKVWCVTFLQQRIVFCRDTGWKVILISQ